MSGFCDSIIFSGITFAIKTLLSGNVNSPVEHSFIDVLLKHPINQMWYMYAISVITLCTPAFKSDRIATTMLILALGLKVIACIPEFGNALPVPFTYLCKNQIWYVLGCLWAYKKLVPKMWITLTSGITFIAIGTAAFVFGYDNSFLDALLTFTGIVASVGVSYEVGKNKDAASYLWRIIAKYMLQIYLLHTIFAAGIRIILIRLGIMHWGIHLLSGILFSIAAPIACGIIADRSRILNIVFFPSKTITKYLK